MAIYTHYNVDLDAVASVWAVRRFVPGMEKALVEFKPANWPGDGFHSGDMAVDINAGGLGLKGKVDPDGTVHSCFASVVASYASEEDQRALVHLVRFVDIQDAHGSTVNHLAPDLPDYSRRTLYYTGINSVLRALQEAHSRDDELVVERMSEIFDGMLAMGRSRIRAVEEAENAEVLPCGKVAITRDAQEFSTSGILFSRGVRAVIYVDGNCLGVVRGQNETIRMDHPLIRRVVEAAGEVKEWFAHPSGFLFCRGSRKNRVSTPSQVDPFELAQAAASVL